MRPGAGICARRDRGAVPRDLGFRAAGSNPSELGLPGTVGGLEATNSCKATNLDPGSPKASQKPPKPARLSARNPSNVQGHAARQHPGEGPSPLASKRRQCLAPRPLCRNAAWMGCWSLGLLPSGFNGSGSSRCRLQVVRFLPFLVFVPASVRD